MANRIKTWIPPTIPLRNNLTAWQTLFHDVHENLVEMGWTWLDTLPDQLNIWSVSTLPADGSFAGSRVYKLNDAASVDNPIFMKLEFGCGSEGLGSHSSYNRSRTPRVRFQFSNSISGSSLDGNISYQSSNPQSINISGNVSSQNNESGVSFYSFNESLGFYGFVYGIGSRNKPYASSSGSYYGSTLSFFIQRFESGFGIFVPALTSSDSTSNVWTNAILSQSAFGQFVPYQGGTPSTASRDMAPRIEQASIYGEEIQLQPVYSEGPNGLLQWPSVATYKTGDIQTATTFDLEVIPNQAKTFVALGNETSMIVDRLNGQNSSFAMLFDDTE